MFKAETNPLCPHEGTTLWSEINDLAAEIAESAAHIPTTHANDMHASLQCVRSLSDSIANLGACQVAAAHYIRGTVFRNILYTPKQNKCFMVKK
jgi:hypothetical protein